MKGTLGAPFGMSFCGFKNERCVYGMLSFMAYRT